MNSPPVMIQLLRRCCPQARWKQEVAYRLSILFLTFVAYMSYHLSRKPISIVKNAKAFLDCEPELHSTTHPDNVTCRSWITEIDGQPESVAKNYLSLLDTSYLFSYSIFMFLSGFVAERMNLRFFLAGGMLLSGLMTVLFGLAYTLQIHSLWYLVIIQIVCGLFQSSGWPGVVTVMANWFGKGKRGLIMGIWNSHTSLGNILGSLVAGAFVNSNWGLSFCIPGLIIGLVGFCVFLFLVPNPEDVGLTPAVAPPSSSSSASTSRRTSDEDQRLLDDEDNLEEGERSGNDQEPAVEVTPAAGNEHAIGFLGALRIPGVLEFSLCLFFAKLVSYTFLYWLPNYISSKSHVDAEESAELSTVFDFGGIIGGIIAGILTDRTGMSATTCSVMLIFAIPMMFLYESLVGSLCPMSEINGLPVHNACFNWNMVILFTTGILVNGPYALITTAVSAELGQHPSLQGSSKALATVTSIIDGTGSIGAAVGPLLAGPLSGNGHWNRVFYMLMGADVMALILLLRLTKNEIVTYRGSRRGGSGTRTTDGSGYRSINS